MASNFAVNLSGSLLASLFFDHVNSKSDQEGFLIGELVSHITDTISDSQICDEKEENCLNVYNYVPCRKLFSFYNGLAEIQEEKLSLILENRRKEVVGWYKFRRNSSSLISLRESALHANLCQHFAPTTSSRFFVFALFTETLSANDSTYSFDHIFFRNVSSGGLESVPLNIVNLGDTSHSEYRTFSRSVVDRDNHSSNYSHLLENCSASQPDHEESTVKQIQEVHRVLQNKLERLLEDVSDTEGVLASLSLELEELNNKTKLPQTVPKEEASSLSA